MSGILCAVVELLTSTWTLVIAPSAIAIAGVYAFVKTLLEKRKLELEIRQLENSERSPIHIPSVVEIEQYSFKATVIKRTIKLSSWLLLGSIVPYLMFSRYSPPVAHLITLGDVTVRADEPVLIAGKVRPGRFPALVIVPEHRGAPSTVFVPDVARDGSFSEPVQLDVDAQPVGEQAFTISLQECEDPERRNCVTARNGQLRVLVRPR